MSNVEATKSKLAGKHFLVVESGDADWKFVFGNYFDVMDATFDYVDEEDFLGSGMDEVDTYVGKFDGIVLHLVAGGYFVTYKEKALETKLKGLPVVVTASATFTPDEEVIELNSLGIGVVIKGKDFNFYSILELLAAQMS